MTSNTNETEIETTDRTLVLRRTYPASRERLWRAFTEPDELSEWFVPDGMTATVHANELEPGGRMAITWTDGEHTIENEGRYTEVVEHERLRTAEETPSGELQLTYEFHEQDGETTVVITQEFPDGVPDGAAEGWAGMLDTLEDVLQSSSHDPSESSDDSVVLDRVIGSPPQRVYEAFVDPDQLVEWYPPSGFEAVIHEFEPTEGGSFRMSFEATVEELEHLSHTFHGTFQVLQPGERIEYTHEFEANEAAMAGETQATITFEALDAGTRLTVMVSGIPEGISSDDAREGWAESLTALDSLVSSS